MLDLGISCSPAPWDVLRCPEENTDWAQGPAAAPEFAPIPHPDACFPQVSAFPRGRTPSAAGAAGISPCQQRGHPSLTVPRAGARPLRREKAPEPGFVPGWFLCPAIPSAEPRVGFGCSLLSGAGNGTAGRLQAPAAPEIPWIYCCWHHPGGTGSVTGNLPRDRGGKAALRARGYNSLFFWAAQSILALEEGGFRAFLWDKSCCFEVSQEYVFFLFLSTFPLDFLENVVFSLS